MELMEGIRPAGPPDMSGRFNEKFAELNQSFIAHELEINLYQLMRTMLAITVDVQAKIATGGLAYIIENAMKPFCRKPKPLPVFPKRFNLVTVGKLRGEFVESLSWRIFSRRRRNIRNRKTFSGTSNICSSCASMSLSPIISGSEPVTSSSSSAMQALTGVLGSPDSGNITTEVSASSTSTDASLPRRVGLAAMHANARASGSMETDPRAKPKKKAKAKSTGKGGGSLASSADVVETMLAAGRVYLPDPVDKDPIITVIPSPPGLEHTVEFGLKPSDKHQIKYLSCSHIRRIYIRTC